MALTPKREAFVREYPIDLNGTQAAIRAGFSPKTANEQAARLLADVSVRSAIDAALAARAVRTEITADRVLQELARVAFFDLRKLYRDDGTMKLPHELDDEAAAVLQSIEVTEDFEGTGGARTHVGFTKKAKIPDKVAALGLAMRHLGMLKDKTELSTPVGQPFETKTTLDVSGLTVDQLRALASIPVQPS